MTIKDKTETTTLGAITIESQKIAALFESLREIEKVVAPKSPPSVTGEYLTLGGVYEILAAGSFNWASVGASNSSEGTRFVASSVGPLSGGAIAGTLSNWKYRLYYDKRTNKARVEFENL
jgi:hypothetical protein